MSALDTIEELIMAAVLLLGIVMIPALLVMIIVYLALRFLGLAALTRLPLPKAWHNSLVDHLDPRIKVIFFVPRPPATN